MVSCLYTIWHGPDSSIFSVSTVWINMHRCVINEYRFVSIPDLVLSPEPVATPGRTPRPPNPGRTHDRPLASHSPHSPNPYTRNPSNQGAQINIPTLSWYQASLVQTRQAHTWHSPSETRDLSHGVYITVWIFREFVSVFLCPSKPGSLAAFLAAAAAAAALAPPGRPVWGMTGTRKTWEKTRNTKWSAYISNAELWFNTACCGI